MSVANHSTKELIRFYNEAAHSLSKPLVKRFADRKSAEKRTAAILKEAGFAIEEPETQERRAPAKAPANGKQKVDGDFGCREGTHRWALLAALRAGRGAAVPQSALLKAVYGATHKEFRAPLAMVMKGLQMAIVANKLACVIEKSRENKELYFALKAKK